MSVTPDPYRPDTVSAPRHLGPPDRRPAVVPQVGPDGPCVLFESEASPEAWIESDLWFDVHHNRGEDDCELEVRWP